MLEPTERVGAHHPGRTASATDGPRPQGFLGERDPRRAEHFRVFLDNTGAVAFVAVHVDYRAVISANGKTIVERDTWMDTFFPRGSSRTWKHAVPGHPRHGPQRHRAGTMAHAVQARAERFRRHLRRPHAGRRNPLTRWRPETPFIGQSHCRNSSAGAQRVGPSGPSGHPPWALGRTVKSRIHASHGCQGGQPGSPLAASS